ncbi:MAG: dihydroorotate dehydrogenase electron transfer subunit [Lachnospiraceae bacterium]|nr:dihydroorotate dehydrogenase electron transfer subunit [Lachnospiraceae bacterium]
MAKIKESAKVISQEMIAGDIYSMWIRTGIASEAVPGQFISLYTKNPARLLPRPISICEIREDALRIVYRIAGEGTKEFSSYKEGDDIDILGPLGNGFPLCDKDAILIGGGIGIPPMLELAKRLKGIKTIVVGYRDKDTFLDKELEKYGKLVIATDDGSVGTKGNVIDAIRENKVTGSVIYACGPTPMLRGVKAYAEETGIEAYISMEERMACGVGACLGCVCKTVGVDDHSRVNNARICKDGPVFNARDVEL